MKLTAFLFNLFFITTSVLCQSESSGKIRVIPYHYDMQTELRDFFHLEGVDYCILKFAGEGLRDKSYTMTVKEIWDGEIRKESNIVNSKDMPFKAVQTVNDSIMEIRVIAKKTIDNKLKMVFNFPRFSSPKVFDALPSDEYSLRNMTNTLYKTIEPGKPFYALAYILPYRKGDVAYYCAVESSGKDIESWGKEFGIKHYLVFEMKFESYNEQ